MPSTPPVANTAKVPQLLAMLELQDSMNQKVHADWRNQGFAWYRAIWVECAELMDHYGWKWWKKQQPDIEQVKLEIIDIWHFGLSHHLQHQQKLSRQVLAEQIAKELEQKSEAKDFRETLESFTQWTLVNRGFSVPEFARLMQAAELGFDELYRGYIGKNVLNFFRQDNGYKEGTYVKQWDGREDNEHLVEICTELDVTKNSFQQDVYQRLSLRYRALSRG